jgi:hypothetical protein
MVPLACAKAISSYVLLQQQDGRQMAQRGISGKPRAHRLMQIFHPCWQCKNSGGVFFMEKILRKYSVCFPKYWFMFMQLWS